MIFRKMPFAYVAQFVEGGIPISVVYTLII